MNIGVVKERSEYESRVALTPAIVETLVSNGDTVFVEAGAGMASGFQDQRYLDAGGQIVYDREEVFGRADMVLKISPLKELDFDMLRAGQMIICGQHLAVAPRKTVETLLEKKVTAVGIELIEDEEGNLPVGTPMSEIAGQLSVIIASSYLVSQRGGRGILMGGIPGVPPANVVILGGGTVGKHAAIAGLGLGAEIVVLDNDVRKLRAISDACGHRVVTGFSNIYNLKKAVAFADVLIGAILIHGGEKAPHLITRDMVKTMKRRSIIIDISIDQGGCVETSRPTDLTAPTFIEEDVIHYCVPNIPSKVARTASHALANALLPYITLVSEKGVKVAMKSDSGFARGVYTFDGKCTNKPTAGIFGLESHEISTLLK